MALDQFAYTPNVNFRGIDQYEFVAKNSYGHNIKNIVFFNIGNPFRDLEPSMAVRGIGCVGCHLMTSSELISDFGAGDTYFFEKKCHRKRSKSI